MDSLGDGNKYLNIFATIHKKHGVALESKVKIRSFTGSSPPQEDNFCQGHIKQMA
jgi:hypothetical protein